MSTVAADVELHPIEGESLTVGDQTAMFHLVVVAIDPYTHESAWLLETAGRILTAFHGADCRVAWLVRAPAQDAVAFLGPWAERVLTFADPDGTAITALGITENEEDRPSQELPPPQNRSILPKVLGCRGRETRCLIPDFASSLANWLWPRQVTYWLPWSVRISSGRP